MKISISTNANIFSSRYTTAHGYRKMASMSNRMNSIPTR